MSMSINSFVLKPVPQNTYPNPGTANVGGVDSDSDNDGSKPGQVDSTAASSSTPAPTPPNPTDTSGNHVNTYA